MIKRNDCQYLVLDGMPFIVTPDKKRWVFARTTKTWVLADPDDWDAVYLNDSSDWEDLFSELPELPEGAIPEQVAKTGMKEFDILQHELDNNLPHWLSPEEKNKNKKPHKQPTKTPYDLSELPNLVDTTSEHLGEGTIIGGWPSTKPKK